MSTLPVRKTAPQAAEATPVTQEKLLADVLEATEKKTTSPVASPLADGTQTLAAAMRLAVQEPRWGDQRTSLFKQYSTQVERQQQDVRDFNVLLPHLIGINFEMEGRTPDKDWDIQKGKEQMKSIGCALQTYTPGIQLARLALQPPPVIRQTMNQGLDACTDEFASQLLDAFRTLEKRSVFGHVDWLAADVVTYHWPTFILDCTRHPSSVVTTTTSRIDNNQEILKTVKAITHKWLCVLIHRTTCHEVINVKRYRLDDRTPFPVPQRVRQLIAAIPRRLRGYFQLLGGDEIYRNIVEREIGRETVTETQMVVSEERRPIFNPEPCLIFAPTNTVITGW